MKKKKTLEDLLQVGNSFQIQRGPDYWIRYHVRAVVDDHQFVIRYWSKVKRRWIYIVEHRVYFKMFYNDGLIK